MKLNMEKINNNACLHICIDTSKFQTVFNKSAVFKGSDSHLKHLNLTAGKNPHLGSRITEQRSPVNEAQPQLRVSSLCCLELHGIG